MLMHFNIPLLFSSVLMFTAVSVLVFNTKIILGMTTFKTKWDIKNSIKHLGSIWHVIPLANICSFHPVINLLIYIYIYVLYVIIVVGFIKSSLTVQVCIDHVQ